jgi:beta-phosphoglucomutase-like phosphatase (HAD superfamily)
MDSEEGKSVWVKKGATLSDKSARKEFGLTQEEIIEAVRDGKLQYRTNSIFGNPYLKLVRSEVEAYVDEKYGSNYLEKKKIKKELAQTNKELKRLKAQVASLEQRKAELLSVLDE